jgi:hypothetical protein
MAASLDGFITRKDGSVDWMETSDHFELRQTRSTVAFYAGDLERFVQERLKPNF